MMDPNRPLEDRKKSPWGNKYKPNRSRSINQSQNENEGQELSMADLLSILSDQKKSLAQDRRNRYNQARERYRSKAKVKRNNNPIAKHPKGWNPSIKVKDSAFKTKPVEPNPNGKDFDFDNKSLWPTFPAPKSREELLALRRKKPWYSVRSGELFNKVEYNVQNSEERSEDEIKRKEKREKRKVQRRNNWTAKHPYPWRASDSASGRVFEDIIASPPYTNALGEKVKRISKKKLQNFRF